VRPYWKGYLKLALVSCPIALHAACLTVARIAFRQVNKAKCVGVARNNKSSLTRHGPPDP
jgi:non-homologous end joining protein Ku